MTEEIWSVGIDGSALMQLTAGYWDLNPAWTADGHYVAVTRRGVRGAEAIYLVPAVGGRAIRLVAVADKRAGSIAWSR